MPKPESSSRKRKPFPGSDLDLDNPKIVTDLFRRAADANRATRGRDGCVVELPEKGRLVMTGDLHDHEKNFARVHKAARLHRSRSYHVIIHEVIHGVDLTAGKDLSIRLLARVAAFKLQYPHQVHILHANHELAQYLRSGIMKDGRSLVELFDEGVEALYGESAEQVIEAMNQFIRSFTLAVRCANGIFCSHSLPSPQMLNQFDTTILDRELTEQDLASGGSAHAMVWGRDHTQELADTLGMVWGVEQFLMGHQPADYGYELEGQTMMILNSDTPEGVILPLNLSKKYTRDDLVENIVELSSVDA